MTGFWSLLRQDARRYFDSSGAGYGRLVLLTPGFQLNICIRMMAALSGVPAVGRILRRVLWYVTKIYHNCDIDVEARFGGGLYLPHPLGIVIGGEWDIGQNVTILQQVTLGRIAVPTKRSTVADRALIGAGAKVIGQIAIGKDARIGANAVVLQDVPDNATAIGVPARIVLPNAALPIDRADP